MCRCTRQKRWKMVPHAPLHTPVMTGGRKLEYVPQQRAAWGDPLRKGVGVARNIALSSAQNGNPCVCSANIGRASKDRWTGDDIHSHLAD